MKSTSDHRSVADSETMSGPTTPLSAFEEYMLLDDNADYPMTHYLQLVVSGSLDPDRFEQAVHDVAARQIRFRSVVRPTSRGWRWVPIACPPNYVSWDQDRNAGERAAASSRLDLTQRPGLRVLVRNEPKQSLLTFQFHHSTCDGVGGAQFAERVAEAYCQGASNHHAAPQADVNQAVTGVGRRRMRRLLAYPVTLLLGLRRLSAFLRLRPVAYRPATDLPGESAAATNRNHPDASPSFVSRTLDDQSSAHLFARAKAAGVTVNDLLLRDTFRSIHATQDSTPENNNPPPIRLLTPVNLRGRKPEQSSDQIANQVGMVFVDRTAAQIADPHALLDGLHAELNRVKRWYLGETSLRTLVVRKRLPGGLRRFLESRNCWATGVLSNLGRPFATKAQAANANPLTWGEHATSDVRFIAPIRRNTRLAIGAVTYAGRLTISIHYDQAAIQRDHAEKILAELLQRLAPRSVAPRHRRRGETVSV